MSLFSELKRRHVFKVGVAYLVAAWLVAQVLDLILDAFPAPDWVMRTVLLLLAAGFVIALLLAWAYELTPEGVRRESEGASISGSPGKRPAYLLNVFVVVALALAVALALTNLDLFDDEPDLEDIVARPSIVVLPFANNSGEAAQDYIAFGLTDELITGLQAMGNFPVISRDASLSFATAETGAREFAEGYGASYYVEGSVNQSADVIRVLVNMSSTRSGQVWAERFQLATGTDDLFEVVDNLISKIATAVLQSEVTRVQRTNRAPVDAWEHYMKGLSVVLEYDDEQYANAREHLDAAVAIAPEMAEAWWAIGELEVGRYLARPHDSDSGLDDVFEIIGYFRRAHELSPFHAAACGCLGYLLTAVGQAGEARAVFAQALEAKPLSSDLRLDYAYYLAWVGQYEDARHNADLSLHLGPVESDRAGVWALRAVTEFARGRDPEAIDAIHRAMFIRKDAYNMPVAVALLYISGEREQAAALYREMRDLFAGLEPRNPLLYVALKPIDDVLAARRGHVDAPVPADVEEIFAALAELTSL